MKPFRGIKAGLSALMLASVMLGGCVVTAQPAYVGPVVSVAPPAPQVEVIGVAPAKAPTVGSTVSPATTPVSVAAPRVAVVP